MQVIKSTPSHPRKCEYGDFELIPEEGWQLSYTFIDYESKLLVASVSVIDRAQWIHSSYGTTIPSREYKVDLNTLSVLQPEDWQKLFNYEKVEILSEDKKYKLISQRVFESDRNSDGFTEELYDANSNALISRGSSIAFQKGKRQNLLDSFLQSKKEKENQERILKAKPTLEEFYQQRMAELKEGDNIIYYYDTANVYHLTYDGQQFVLSRTGALPSDHKQWKEMTYTVIRNYVTLDEFWKEFSSDPKWYLKYKPLNRQQLISSKVLVLANHVISFFNEVRKKIDFTYQEYGDINTWSALVWSAEYRETEIKQWCPCCLKEVAYQARYPKYICFECMNKKKYNAKGNLLEFSNLSITGGFRVTCTDTNGKVLWEDESQDSCDCRIDGELYYAKEAKFGGIVIQLK